MHSLPTVQLTTCGMRLLFAEDFEVDGHCLKPDLNDCADRVFEVVDVWIDHMQSLVERYKDDIRELFIRSTTTIEKYLQEVRAPKTPLTALGFWRLQQANLSVVDDYTSHPHVVVAKKLLQAHRPEILTRFSTAYIHLKAAKIVCDDAVKFLSYLEPYESAVESAKPGDALQSVVDAVPAILTGFRMLWVSSKVYGPVLIVVPKGQPTTQSADSAEDSHPGQSNSTADSALLAIEKLVPSYIPRNGGVNFRELLEQQAASILRTLKASMLRLPQLVTTNAQRNRHLKLRFLECREICLGWKEYRLMMKEEVLATGFPPSDLADDVEQRIMDEFEYLHARAADWVELLDFFEAPSDNMDPVLEKVAQACNAVADDFDFTEERTFELWERFQQHLWQLVRNEV